MRGDRVQGAETGLVRQRRAGDVVLLAPRQPARQLLSVAVRAALLSALTEAEADPQVQAILLVGDAKTFAGGVDLAELDRPLVSPTLFQTCARIAACAKPVIAVLRGAVTGGGLDLALAAHWRVADARARLAFPEIHLGLVPGGGGIQRLVRLTGADPAMRLLLSGNAVSASGALAIGLVDHVVDGHPVAHALRLARDQPAHPGLTRAIIGPGKAATHQAAVGRMRARLLVHEAAARMIDCVEAALLLPPDQALGFEQAAFGDLCASATSVALRHIHRAERRAAYPPPLIAGCPLPPIIRIGLWGADRDSADLALRALQAGLRVSLADPDREKLGHALRQIAARADSAVNAGQIAPEARDADWARLTSAPTADGLLGCDLILTTASASALPGLLCSVPQMALGVLPSDGSVELALTCKGGRTGVIEVQLGRAAHPDDASRAAALATRLGGRVVFCGTGGPMSDVLTAAFEATLDHLRASGTPPDAIAALRAQFSAEIMEPSAAPPPALTRICLAALANAGARLLHNGCARRPGDIDTVAVHAGLMPRAMGGPMHQADVRGLLLLRADLRAAGDAAIFAPSPMIDDLIARGIRFGALDAPG